jgi:starch synthase (maltosyl-transferring)
LTELRNLRFHDPDKENLLAFSKTSAGHDPVLVIVNLNPHGVEEGMVHLDLGALGLNDTEAFEVHDLITNETYVWHGSTNYVRLDPNHEPAHIFRVRG